VAAYRDKRTAVKAASPGMTGALPVTSSRLEESVDA
jgi:hypothetical protein